MRQFTGKHMLAVTLSFFGVIIAVNLFMAYNAISTFPGVEVGNSYVASQNFNERRDAQVALGWTMNHAYENGEMKVAFTDQEGTPVEVKDIFVLIGRPTSSLEDHFPMMAWNGAGYGAKLDLASGPWMLKVTARSVDGVLFEKREDFLVRK